MTKARILHIIYGLVPGGAENHLAMLLLGLKRQGYEVEVAYLLKGYNSSEGLYTSAGIPVHSIGMTSWVAPAAVIRLVRLMTARRYALVHTHLARPDVYGAVAATLAGIPKRVTSQHDVDLRKTKPVPRQVYRLLANSAARVVAISDKVKYFLLHQGIVKRSEKIRVIHYGFDGTSLTHQVAPNARGAVRAEMGLDREAYVIGNVGRLVEEKGQKYLIEALAHIIVEQGIPVHLLIAGQGPLHSSLEKLAAALGVSPFVHLLGQCSDVPNLLAALDLFVFPSLWEGFGLVQLEAMALALPIIASNIHPLCEVVVDGQTGLLVPPRDPQALSEAIVRLYREPDLAGQLGRAGKKRLETHFSVSAMVAATAQLYEEVLAEA